MKQTLSLNGGWKIAGFDEGQGNWAHEQALLPVGAIQADALVPGEVHVALARSGVIPDPFYGLNANEVQWVEQKEWWYKRTFDVDDGFLQKKTFLEFDGLDTYATIYLNNEEIGRTSNMFIPHRFDVTSLLHAGRNTLAVKFAPTAALLSRMDTTGLSGCFDVSRVNARKMQCAFGWDWTHRFVGAGIWRDVRLVSYDGLSIADVHVEPEIVGNYADAWITIEVENHTGEDKQAKASVVLAIGEAREKIEVVDWISPFGGIMEAVIRIEEPELWWPNGFGEPTLYTLMVGMELEGEVQDVAETRFGVRTIGIVERDEHGGNAFTMLVNGEEVFCKGANWIPADHFPSSVTPDRCRDLVKQAKDANLNMLRVWGGGIYEQQAFYDACDEMGIMVWQDFMFACATYPDSNIWAGGETPFTPSIQGGAGGGEAFERAVAQEAETIVKRLRNHPSIMVWCGNNECEMNYAPDADWPGKRLFHEVIPNVLKRMDHTRPYRPSSPYGGAIGNDPAEGNFHGGTWWRTYLGDEKRWRHTIEELNGLFVSEFYAEGPPEVASLRQFIPEDKLFPTDNETWEFHNKDNPHSGRTDGLTNHQILLDLTRRMMGDYSNVDEFAAYAGIIQGEFVRAEFEHFRREKWAISGGLFWMLDDCWPAISWSLIDYYGRPKPAYYYAKRACEPVICSFKQLEDRVQLYVTSDSRLQAVDGVCRVGILTFETCGFESQKIDVQMPPNSSRAIWESAPIDSIITDPTRQCLVALLESRGKQVAKAVWFPRLFGEMEFPRPKLLVEREQLAEDRHAIAIAVDAFARNVTLGNLPASARPSDNYFDLLPGERHVVTIDGLSVEQANELRINVWRR